MSSFQHSSGGVIRILCSFHHPSGRVISIQSCFQHPYGWVISILDLRIPPVEWLSLWVVFNIPLAEKLASWLDISKFLHCCKVNCILNIFWQLTYLAGFFFIPLREFPSPGGKIKCCNFSKIIPRTVYWCLVSKFPLNPVIFGFYLFT